jgi:diguanylate cyclase (GGDEF)-like protein
VGTQATSGDGGDARCRTPSSERAARLESLLATPARGLRLPSTLEAAFRLHYLEDGIARLRFGMLTGLLLFGAFACWDITTFPPDVLPWSLAIRLGIACPLLGMVLYATHRAWSPAMLDALRLVMAFGIGVSVVAITALANASGWEAQPHGLFLIAVAAYTITGMRTPQAMLAGLSVLPMQIACDLLTQRSAVQMVEPALFILTGNAIGYAASVGHERAARTSFLRMKLLEFHADQDGLTGIANRRRFDASLERVFQAAVREKAGVAVAIFDVDCFKQYNDRLGHLAGDECLRLIGRATDALARRPLDVAARIGGEEFAVVWYDASPQGAHRLAREIRSAVETLAIERPDEAPRHHLTVSVGAVQVYPAEARPLDVLGEADQALYQAKRAGRDAAVVRILEFDESAAIRTSAP